MAREYQTKFIVTDWDFHVSGTLYTQAHVTRASHILLLLHLACVRLQQAQSEIMATLG